MHQKSLSMHRRAALDAFDGILSGDTLIDALWEIEENLAGDGITEVIKVIHQLSQRHALDALITKRLYKALFEALRKPSSKLPEDPWLVMQAARAKRTSTPQPASSAMSFSTNTVSVVPAPSMPALTPLSPPADSYPPPTDDGFQMWSFVDIAAAPPSP
jgi:hypothetical protein